MQVNNVNFGSTFKFNQKQLRTIGEAGKLRLEKTLNRYANVSENQLSDLFTSKTPTLRVADANDPIVVGFFKTVGINPKKV